MPLDFHARTGVKETPLTRRLTKGLPLFVLFILLSMAVFLRIYRLGDFPVPVNFDELSNIYDGYCIAETGADRWGLKYPVILRGFGDLDYRPPLYAWLSAGSIRVLGYSVMAGRLPSAVLGILSLLLVWLTAKKIGSRSMAWLALLSAAFSPWHLSYSRLASEGAALTAFLVILALYLWIRAREKHYPVSALLILGLVMGLGTSTYQATKLIFFLLALLLLADLWRHPGRFLKKALLFGGACLIGAAPQLLTLLLLPERFMARAQGTLMPFSFTFYYVSQLLRNFFSHLSPDFLFFSFSDFNYETLGRLLPVEFVFFYLGLFHLGKAFRRPDAFPPLYFYLLLLMAIFPSSLTDSTPHALRASGLMVLLPLVSAAGMVYVRDQISGQARKKAFLILTAGLVVANGLYFVREYAGSETLQHHRQQHFLVQLATRLNQIEDQYPRIYLEHMGFQPYLYIAHYCGIHPSTFQQAPKVVEKQGWDRVKQLGKYHFLAPAEIDRAVAGLRGKSLIVLQERHPAYKLIDSLEVYNHKRIFFYESF